MSTSTQASSSRLTQRSQTSGWVSPTCGLYLGGDPVPTTSYTLIQSSLSLASRVYTIAWEVEFTQRVRYPWGGTHEWRLEIQDAGIAVAPSRPCGQISFKIVGETANYYPSVAASISNNTIYQRSGRTPWMLPGDHIFFTGSWTI